MLDGHRPRARAISFDILIWAPVLLFSMVAHEYAHAEAAYRQGDDTAYMLGRLTLNPLKHIDPIMTVLLPVVLWLSHAGFLFGAAKPVPVNPRNYRKFVRGDVIVSLAASLEILQRMMFYGMRLNLVLAFFNLIPIPPLDGSHVFYHLLPPGWGLKYRQFYQLGMLPLFLILWLAPALLTPFLWPASALLQLGWSVVGRYALPGGLPAS